jgi:hypothetical protein
LNAPKKTGAGLTPAQREAETAFKPPAAALTDNQQLKKDIDDNLERLKALRLKRDADAQEK